MISNQFELILIFVSVIIGVLASAYFYLSTSIFMDTLKRPLKFVASGMIIMAIDVLLAAFVTFESSRGVNFAIYGFPLQGLFFLFYIIGSLLIGFGARQFAHRPSEGATDVALGSME